MIRLSLAALGLVLSLCGFLLIGVGGSGPPPSTFTNFAVGEAYMNEGIASNYATGSGYLND